MAEEAPPPVRAADVLHPKIMEIMNHLGDIVSFHPADPPAMANILLDLLTQVPLEDSQLPMTKTAVLMALKAWNLPPEFSVRLAELEMDTSAETQFAEMVSEQAPELIEAVNASGMLSGDLPFDQFVDQLRDLVSARPEVLTVLVERLSGAGVEMPGMTGEMLDLYLRHTGHPPPPPAV